MIRYNPKDWFLIIFKFHKADTFRKLLPLIIALCGYAWLITWLEKEIWKLSDTSHVKNLSLIHSSLGMVISLLLVFRTNTAYERWWEGRKVWGGLVNSSRNLALKIKALVPEEAGYFAVMIPNFAFALKNHLRKVHLEEELEPAEGFSVIPAEGSHLPNRIALQIMKYAAALEKSGKLKPEHLLLMQPELSNFTDATGACERIRNTPIPYSYSVFLKKFMFLYVMTLPFGFVFSLGYLTIPVVAIIFYVLASLELIAEEIEDPFGKDANDLPTDEIANGIRKTVKEILS
ncbi:MAG: bestrophin family ion channel [Bacteroidia bacterium]